MSGACRGARRMAERSLLGRRRPSPGFDAAFRILAETMPDGLALLDAQGRILHVGRHLGAGTPHAEADVLTQARDFGLVTKSNLILGMGETREEVSQALVDLHAAGCELVTITQYLRPSVRHHPVERWVKPEEFVELAAEAGANALRAAGLDAAEVDLVLVATMSHDELTPAAGPLVAERLGAAGTEAPGPLASAVELALEHLYLTRKLAKDDDADEEDDA